MLYFKFIQIVLLKLFNNLIKLIISVKNVLTRVEQMMVVVQVDLVSAAHVSFTLILYLINIQQWCDSNLFHFLVSLGCGSTNSENNSYIIQSSSTSVSNPCKHKICPCSTNVCRIRYDFSVSIKVTMNQTLICLKSIWMEIKEIIKNNSYPEFALILDFCHCWSPYWHSS